jgi:pyrimidine deaminase RibD-like protein
MRHCLQLTLLCPVSQTAFCVGSTLFLPSSSAAYESLRPHFPAFNTPTHSSSDPSISAAGAGTGDDSTTNIAGLILGDGYSRQIPGNTHAEANALTNFRTAYAALLRDAPQGSLPAVDEVLAEVDCYATMEPCSVRTSGGPSCALELVRARVKTVYLVSAKRRAAERSGATPRPCSLRCVLCWRLTRARRESRNRQISCSAKASGY